MIDFGKDLTIGHYYTLDEMFNNTSTVKLIRKDTIFGTIESKDSTWEVMLTRLSPIKNQDESLRNI